MIERVCFTLQIKPERLGEYRQRHADVWPEMLDALRLAGWRSYSLFLREDGLLIGCLETEDFKAAQKAMAATRVNALWQASMAEFFQGLGGEAPDRAAQPIEEIFHLD